MTRGVDRAPVLETAPPTHWRTLDFLLFLLLPIASLQVAGYPVSELAMLSAVGLAATRRPQLRVPGWLPAILGIFLLWLVITSLLNDLTPYRRLLHLVLFCTLVLFVAQGRFAMRALSSGLAVGLLAAAGAGFLGLGNAGYEGRLTGLLGDPNVAGYYLVSLGAVAAAHIATSKRRLVFLAVVVLLVGLTFSRTSILALGLAGVWIIVGRRLSPLVNVSLTALLLYVVSRSIEYLRLVGPFAERAGSDALRDRIVDLEKVQIGQAPWLGNGPGTSQVLVDGQPFFFHNSYLALQNEGGWVAVGLFLALGLTVLLTLAGLPQARRNVWLEGAVVAVATCAGNLGEVLLELPAAVVLGAALCHMLRSRDAQSRVGITSGRGQNHLRSRASQPPTESPLRPM
jgi:hypothetical protein